MSNIVPEGEKTRDIFIKTVIKVKIYNIINISSILWQLEQKQ